MTTSAQQREELKKAAADLLAAPGKPNPYFRGQQRILERLAKNGTIPVDFNRDMAASLLPYFAAQADFYINAVAEKKPKFWFLFLTGSKSSYFDGPFEKLSVPEKDKVKSALSNLANDRNFAYRYLVKVGQSFRSSTEINELDPNIAGWIRTSFNKDAIQDYVNNSRTKFPRLRNFVKNWLPTGLADFFFPTNHFLADKLRSGIVNRVAAVQNPAVTPAVQHHINQNAEQHKDNNAVVVYESTKSISNKNSRSTTSAQALRNIISSKQAEHFAYTSIISVSEIIFGSSAANFLVTAFLKLSAARPAKKPAVVKAITQENVVAGKNSTSLTEQQGAINLAAESATSSTSVELVVDTAQKELVASEAAATPSSNIGINIATPNKDGTSGAVGASPLRNAIDKLEAVPATVNQVVCSPLQTSAEPAIVSPVFVASPLANGAAFQSSPLVNGAAAVGAISPLNNGAVFETSPLVNGAVLSAVSPLRNGAAPGSASPLQNGAATVVINSPLQNVSQTESVETGTVVAKIPGSARRRLFAESVVISGGGNKGKENVPANTASSCSFLARRGATKVIEGVESNPLSEIQSPIRIS